MSRGVSYPSMAMVNDDEVFIGANCESVPNANTATTSEFLKVYGRNTDLGKSQLVSRFKPTIQSSIANYRNEPPGKTTTQPPLLGIPQNAVDGNVMTTTLAGSCTHTEVQTDPWWQVDMQQRMDVVSVEIWARADPMSEGVPGMEGHTLMGFEVWVGDEATSLTNLEGYASGTRCGNMTHNSVAGGLQSVYCGPASNGTQGRYVTIRVPGSFKQLTLCEVLVYEGNVFDAMSVFFAVPSSLSTSYQTVLKLCVATKEMRAYGQIPLPTDFRELEDTLTITRTPSLPTGWDHSVRAVTGTAPDFTVEFAKGGD